MGSFGNSTPYVGEGTEVLAADIRPYYLSIGIASITNPKVIQNSNVEPWHVSYAGMVGFLARWDIEPRVTWHSRIEFTFQIFEWHITGSQPSAWEFFYKLNAGVSLYIYTEW